MVPTVDRALWHLLRERQMSIYTVAAVYLAITIALAVLCFIVVEKRTRSRWLEARGSSVVAGDGPYRQGLMATFLGKAPVLVRMTSLAGVVIGMTGLVWPVLLVLDLRHGSWTFGALMLVEVVGATTAALSFVGGVSLLRRKHSSTSVRRTRALHVIAAILFLFSAACLLHAFDDVEVMAHGIKWRETMTLGAFMRSGFSGFVDGHVGLAWRVVLRAASIFGVFSAAFIVLYTRVKLDDSR